MKELIREFKLDEQKNYGLYWWREGRAGAALYVLGKYDGTVFEGGDRLSMAVMQKNNLMLPLFKSGIVIAEGDRFSNSTFIKDFEPLVIRIRGNGLEGRLARGTTQTDRHITSIATRVANIPADAVVENSREAFDYLRNEIKDPQLTKKPQESKPDLFS